MVKDTYDEIGPFNYQAMIEDGVVDSDKLREMCDVSIMADGSKYKGQFKRKATVKDGIGQIIYKDGSLFEGAFLNDDTLYGR